MLRRYINRVLAVITLAALLISSGCVTISTRELPTQTLESGLPSASADVSPDSTGPSSAPVTEPEFGDGQRTEQFTQILGGGRDTVTIMLYLCGSDLESYGGFATSDLYELMAGTIGPNVNVIVETGGAKEWQNTYVKSTTNQRFELKTGEMTLVQDDLGKRDMTSPDTLSDFIRFCADNYPANRYMLLLWDHGGGSLSGYGYDEIFDSGSMMLDGVKQALEDGGVKFEIIGFDACLMSTAETAFVLKDYADYMLASQKLEPGCGWYYTNWISRLSADSSIPALELARIIADDYVEISGYEDYMSETTLAMVDLLETERLYSAMRDYFVAANEMLLEGEFADMSRARADIGQSGGSGRGRMRGIETDYDHIDLVHLAENLQNGYSDELIEAVNNAVTYFSYNNTSNVNGITIYFPYYDLSYFNVMVELYDRIGLDEEYVGFISNFISVMLGGREYDEAEGWSDYDWYDDSLVDYYNDYYGDSSDYGGLEVWLKGDNYVLSLSDEDWDTIVGIEVQVYLDDYEGGYIELGSDNIYEFDEDGDLCVVFDNTWVSIDGMTVAYYNEFETITEDDFWYTYGSSPAFLNGEPCDIIIMWDGNNPYGYVAGARFSYDGTISQKGYTPLKDGDIIEFTCDYYLYDGTYDDWYYFNEEYIVNGTPEISYEDIGEGDCLVYYMLVDIYGNSYFTEPVLFYDTE